MINKLIYVLLLVMCSCEYDMPDEVVDSNGVYLRRKPLWATRTGEGSLSLEAMGDMSPNPILNNNILVGGEKDNQPYVYLLEINDGDLVWKMNLYDTTESIRSHQYLNNVIFEGKGGQFNNLSLTEHKIKWQTSVYGSFWFWLTGIDSLFFASGYEFNETNPYEIHSAWVGNVLTGEFSKFYTPIMEPIDTANIPSINGIGGVDYILPFRNNAGDICLVIYTSKIGIDFRAAETYFGLYNYSKSEWIYNKIPMGDKPEMIVGEPEVFNDRIYQTTTSDMACFDLLTGKLIWKTGYNTCFYSNGHIIVDDNIIGSFIGGTNEATQYLVCHDINTGFQKWMVPITGMPSKLKQLNGIIYFTTLGGWLNSFVANTGHQLWYVEDPEEDGFKDECEVILGKNEEKGRIIVSTWRYCYCYEAVW